MPSPACQVKDGGGAYSATTNGVNVTPSNTVTINLISSAGVNSWSITCIATDELSSAATVTSSLVIDTVAKTATFTAPVAGRAYLFQSKINGGIGPDGTAQASYTTTFGVYTLTGGRRVHAVGETFESNATFGWEADINDLIRNPGGTTPGGSSGDIQTNNGSGGFGAITPGSGISTFLATPSSANLRSALTDETGSGAAVFATSPTISAPTLSSTPTLSGASTSTSNNAKGTCTDVNPVNVQTTTTGNTLLDSFALATSDSAVIASWMVVGIKSDGTQAAGFMVSACVRNDSGTLSHSAGSPVVSVVGRDDSAWSSTVDFSGTTVQLQVAGNTGDTVQWTAIRTSLAVIP